MAASPDSVFQRGAERAACVGVHAFAFAPVSANGQGQAYWTVEFVAATGDGVGAYIDRASGAVRLALFPNEFQTPLASRCGGDA